MLGDGFLGALTLGFTGLGALASSAGDLGTAAFFFAGGAFPGVLTALSLSMWRLRRRTSSRAVRSRPTAHGRGGVVLCFSTWRYYGLTAALLMGSAFLGVHAAGGVLGWEMPPPVPQANAIAVAIAGFGALLFLWLFIEFVSGRIVKGWLALTPAGIHHRSHTFEHFVPWSAVLEVSAMELGAGPLIVVRTFPSDGAWIRRTHWMGKPDEFGLLPSLVVRARSLAVDPAVAYHALRYYHAHPESRGELLTPVGERRIRSGNVVA
ncbi:hypothetical protein FHX44_113798 [Pseudonocardia hierapolitana]|uniref:Uncharacterized protein n=1 Tax=Pseudonocardia hierapolitana TaxID=1128676 RepID=A0A561SSP3_9PSEU|nr:hypothetical protein [Pseudonocardia hierapolitana]TWF77883.1 hypothetical protein FHX44_113798 [Pseudonocardia hierapolitana]